MFTVHKEEDKEDPNKDKVNDKELLPYTKLNCLYQRLQNMKLSFCENFVKSKEYRLFEKGRELLSKEIDVVKLIKSHRLRQKVIDTKIKMTQNEKETLKKQALTVISLTSDSDTSDGSSKEFNFWKKGNLKSSK